MTSPAVVRERLAGCIAPIVTPFDADGRISRDGLAAVLDFLSAGGASGIVPGDLVGEYPALSLDERRELIESTVHLARGRFLVMALVSDPSVETAISLARFAESAGVDAIKIALPYPYVPAKSMVLEYVQRVAGAVRAPYVVESSDALEVSLDVIGTLCADPRFVGVEEMGSDTGRLCRLHREYSKRLALLPAGDTALLVLCLLGAPGCIAAECNFAPRFILEFLDACHRRDLARAMEMFDRRARYRDHFRSGLGHASFTPWTKAAMELLGVPVGRPRLPHEPLDAESLRRLRDELGAQFSLIAVR